MFKDVDKLHERYLTGEHGDKTDDIDVFQTVALKSECDLTVGQFRGCRKFALQNQVGSNLFIPYKKVLSAEVLLDFGNVAYEALKDGIVVDHNEAAPNSSIIDADTDIGCISFEMMNPNIEGNRVKLADSICKEVEEIYPHLLQLCDQKYRSVSENSSCEI